MTPSPATPAATPLTGEVDFERLYERIKRVTDQAGFLSLTEQKEAWKALRTAAAQSRELAELRAFKARVMEASEKEIEPAVIIAMLDSWYAGQCWQHGVPVRQILRQRHDAKRALHAALRALIGEAK